MTAGEYGNRIGRIYAIAAAAGGALVLEPLRLPAVGVHTVGTIWPIGAGRPSADVLELGTRALRYARRVAS